MAMSDICEVDYGDADNLVHVDDVKVDDDAEASEEQRSDPVPTRKRGVRGCCRLHTGSAFRE